MIKEAIILAGGLGTRLRSVVPDVPKCMAQVAGKPFLSYIIDWLLTKEVTKFIFSIGYKKEVISHYLQKYYPTLNYTLSIEENPLGTGGAIQLACKQAREINLLVLNGDTFFNIDIDALYKFNKSHGAFCSVSLKPMLDFNRYGVVELNNDNSICSFKEKQYFKSGLINGGVYLIDKNHFLEMNLPEVFSFEKDYLEKFCKQYIMYGFVQDKYIIDIGIPEDFNRAQVDFMSFNIINK